ncbi:MAG TPA: PhoH family protein [Thermoguttaceae bacterium]|nr:PhoH family protein [Thermoguttaceae bacterium]
MTETSIAVVDSRALVALFGTCDQHLRKLRKSLEVEISSRDGRIHVEGEPEAVAKATHVLEQLQAHAQQYGRLAIEDVDRVLAAVAEGREALPSAAIGVGGGREVRARTPGQAKYVKAMRGADLTMCAGPAGTGKTYLAVAMAVAALREQQVRKIILVRPAVEAGESLGFLPGDLQAKINPYLRPLLDALREMMDYDLMKRYQEEDIIEIIPLAYMRGRTLNQAFMILDEAQNTTVAQMKMFLTRMGEGSKIVVSGDTTQVDLPHGTRSGLIDALVRLRKLKGVAAVKLTASDIVRHPLVQRIVDAYDGRPKQRP